MDCHQHVQKMHKLPIYLLAEETESTVMEDQNTVYEKNVFSRYPSFLSSERQVPFKALHRARGARWRSLTWGSVQI